MVRQVVVRVVVAREVVVREEAAREVPGRVVEKEEVATVVAEGGDGGGGKVATVTAEVWGRWRRRRSPGWDASSR